MARGVAARNQWLWNAQKTKKYAVREFIEAYADTILGPEHRIIWTAVGKMRDGREITLYFAEDRVDAVKWINETFKSK